MYRDDDDLRLVGESRNINAALSSLLPVSRHAFLLLSSRAGVCLRARGGAPARLSCAVRTRARQRG